MKHEKEIKELLKGSEDTYLIATKNGTAVVGYNSSVLSLLTMLIRDVRQCEGINEEMIDKAIQLSKASEKEILEDTLKMLQELINKIK